MASINPYQFEPKRRNESRPTNVGLLGGRSHTPDVPVLLHDVTASALEIPIMNRYNTVIKQSPPYRRLAVNRVM